MDGHELRIDQTMIWQVASVSDGLRLNLNNGPFGGTLRPSRTAIAGAKRKQVQRWRSTSAPEQAGPPLERQQWARDRAGLCRQGLCRRRRAKAAPGLPLRPKARRPWPDQKGTQAALRHRGRHRPLQDRRPSRPKLPERTSRRPHQRRHERRRLQPAPHPQLVEETLARYHRRPVDRDDTKINTQNGFLTADSVGPHFPGPR